MSEKQMANITEEANEARLSILASEINTIKRQTQKIMMEAAVEIGRRLVEAKGAVGHGGWGAWLEHNVDYSERTAQNLIRIFQEYGEGQQRLFGSENPQAFADLTYTQAVALLGIKNPDERAEFVETHDVQNMTSRELADAIKERDAARAEAEEEKQKAVEAEEEKKLLREKIEALTKELDEAKEDQGDEEPDEETEKRIEEMEKDKAALEEQLEQKEKTIKQIQKERDDMEKAKAALGDAWDKTSKENAKLKNKLDEKQKTLEGLEAKITELSNKPADTGKAAFAAYFDLAKNAVNGMLEAIGKIEEGQDKYKAAMVKMLEAMIETAKEG